MRNDTEKYFHYTRLQKQVQELICELSAQSKNNPSYKHIWQIYQKIIEFERNEREMDTQLYDTLPQLLPEMQDPAGGSQSLLNDRDAILAAQKASNGYQAILKILKQVRQLAVRLETGTTDEASKAELKNQIASNVNEIHRISSKSNYNGISLLDGDSPSLDGSAENGNYLEIHVGTSATNKIEMFMKPVTPAKLGITDLHTLSGAEMLPKLDEALVKVSDGDYRVGHDINELRSAQQKSREDLKSVSHTMESSLREIASYFREMAQFYYSICPKKDIPSSLQ